MGGEGEGGKRRRVTCLFLHPGRDACHGWEGFGLGLRSHGLEGWWLETRVCEGEGFRVVEKGKFGDGGEFMEG